MRRIAELIDTTLQSPEDADVAERVRDEVRELTAAFPLYPAPLEAASPVVDAIGPALGFGPPTGIALGIVEQEPCGATGLCGASPARRLG